jgi:hypothetical protein
MRYEPEAEHRKLMKRSLPIECVGEARDGSRGKGAAFEVPSPVSTVETGASGLMRLVRSESGRA